MSANYLKCTINIEVDGKVVRTIQSDHAEVTMERDVIWENEGDGKYILGGEYFVQGWSKDAKKGYRGKLPGGDTQLMPNENTSQKIS